MPSARALNKLSFVESKCVIYVLEGPYSGRVWRQCFEPQIVRNVIARVMRMYITHHYIIDSSRDSLLSTLPPPREGYHFSRHSASTASSPLASQCLPRNDPSMHRNCRTMQRSKRYVSYWREKRGRSSACVHVNAVHVCARAHCFYSGGRADGSSRRRWSANGLAVPCRAWRCVDVHGLHARILKRE